MMIYCAGPLFNEAERGFISAYAKRFREAGIECFVPHEHPAEEGPMTADFVFHKDWDDGISKANAMVAWLDGPMVDDGTACEVGIYFGLMQQNEPWRKGVLGLCTDRRRTRNKDVIEHGGLNRFLTGTIGQVGKVCWSVDEVLEQLLVWKRELQAA
jgi:nucleoside 2-deoxyribosyltransferase